MTELIRRTIWVAAFMLTVCGSLLAQLKGIKGSTPGGNGAPQNSGSSTLAGETYPLNGWPTRRPDYSHQRIIWYKVVAVPSKSLQTPLSKSQPLILEPLSCLDEPNPPEPEIFDSTDFAGCDGEGFPGGHLPSIPERDENPLVDGEKLVIAISDPGLFDTQNVLLLNFNLTAQPGSPINPAPLRPTVSTSAPSGAPSPPRAMTLDEKGLVLAECKGPAKISVVAGTPQSRWDLSAFNPLEAKVVNAAGGPLAGCPVEFQGLPDAQSTRVFTNALGIAEIKNHLEPLAPGHWNVSATVTLIEGISMVKGASTVKGNAVFDLSSFKVYYLPWMNRLTGDTIPTVTITATLSPPPSNSSGSPRGVPGGTDIPGRNQPPPKDCACAVAVATALAKQLTAAGDGQGDQAQETSLTLLNASYAQVHNLYTYNIATGLVYSFLRNQTYSRVESAAPAGCTSSSSSSCVSPELYATVTNPTSPTIDPALFFTVYVLGSSDAPRKWGFIGRFDAERKWAWSDLYPQPSIGFSLSSPSTDFFGGFSSEVWRGVQIVYGDHIGKVNYLAPTLTTDPTSSAPPVTLTHFRNKFFFGVTFDITFIQTLFGGGKGGGGSQ